MEGGGRRRLKTQRHFVSGDKTHKAQKEQCGEKTREYKEVQKREENMKIVESWSARSRAKRRKMKAWFGSRKGNA